MDMIPLAPPKAAPEPLPELATFLAPFAPLFQRAQSRHSLERYVTGLLTDLPRKNCDTIAAAVAGTSTERLQHLLTDALWDPLLLDEQRVRHLVAHSPAHGILALDDTGLPKQGKASPGVARQYSGTLGKVGNCQVVVTAEYSEDACASSSPCHWPVSAAIYLPAPWASDPDRRQRAAIPTDLAFATKIELALALIDRARGWDVPFAAVTADAGYGSNPHFLAGLETRQLPYVVVVEKRFGLREPAAVQAVAVAPPPVYGGRGRPRKQPPPPLATAEAVATRLAAEQWQTLTWREGTQGALRKRFAAVRVHRATGSPATTNPERITTGPEGWLLAERPLPGEDGETRYYYSNFPADTPLVRLVQVAHARWVIEQFYEDAKGECGLDDYQGRRWDGLQRHLALVMLSYSFLALQRSAPGAPDRGLSPLGAASVPAGSPSPDARLAVPGPRALAHHHRPDQGLPSSTELTK